MYSVIIINMLTCAEVLIFKFYSKSVESNLISGMAVQRNKQKPTCQYSSDSMSPSAVHRRKEEEFKPGAWKNGSRLNLNFIFHFTAIELIL